MVLLMWTQLNNLIEAGRATFAAIFDEKLRPSGVVLFVMQKYGPVGCHFIIEQYAGQRWRDSVVFWRDHTHDY